MKLVPINSAEFFPNVLLKSLYSFVLICSCLSPVSPLFPSLPAVEGKTHGSIFCRRGWRTWPDCSLPAVSPGLCFPSNPTTSRSLWGAGKTPFPSAPWTNMCGCCYPVSGLCANTTVTLTAHLFLAMPKQDRATPAGLVGRTPSTSSPSPGRLDSVTVVSPGPTGGLVLRRTLRWHHADLQSRHPICFSPTGP